jgi:antitoxin MazE
MNTTIQKWGNSLAVRLPKNLATDAHLAQGVEIQLVPTNEGLLLKPTRKRRYRLSHLVAGITRKNLHSEMHWGPAVGREILE